MRRVTLPILIFALAPGASAKVPWVKRARELGIVQIETCKSCHAERNAKDSLKEVGTWLVAQKAARQAAECDVAWLKDYYARK